MQQACPSELLFEFGYLRFDHIVHRDEGDKHHEIFKPTDAFASKGNVGNCQSYFIAQNQSHALAVKAPAVWPKEFLSFFLSCSVGAGLGLAIAVQEERIVGNSLFDELLEQE